MTVRASVVVLGYRAEPYLDEAVAAILADLGPDDELVLVDNGIEVDSRVALERRLSDHTVSAGPTVVRIGDGHNLGFAGGCNRGVAAASGEVVVFVNSDAVVRPGTLPHLIEVSRRRDAIVCGCLRLADEPELVNSVGNPLQFLGITWAGHCGEPADAYREPGPVAIATGGLFALRRSLWDRLGGFDESYFAYHEDTDLSLRAWLIGASVGVEPDAVADHHYDFGRSPMKMFLLERNRWFTVLVDYPRPLLAVALPMMLATELPLLAVAVRQGWGRHKLAAWGAVLRNLPLIRRRRRIVQAQTRVDAAVIADLLVARIEPPMVAAPPGMGALNAVLDAYWARVRPRRH